MDFRAGAGATRLMRIVVGAAATALAMVLWLPSCFFAAWSAWWAVVPLVLSVPITLWYVPRFTRSIRGALTDEAVYAAYGIVWQRELFVPVEALRTFEIWTLPLHRLFRCRTVILRFAGGAAWLPLLEETQAYALTEWLEHKEDRA